MFVQRLYLDRGCIFAVEIKLITMDTEMHYELIGIGLVKMMVGVKRTGEKVQYCITAIEA